MAHSARYLPFVPLISTTLCQYYILGSLPVLTIFWLLSGTVRYRGRSEEVVGIVIPTVILQLVNIIPELKVIASVYPGSRNCTVSSFQSFG